MSTAPAEVAPVSDPIPEQPGSQPEPTSRDRRPKSWRVRVIIAFLLVALGLLSTFAFRTRSALSTTKVQTTYQNSVDGVRLKGTTEAVEARAILAPLLAGQQIGTLTIIHLAPAGAKVKRGDLLVEFDRQAQTRDTIDKQAEYQKLVNQVA